MRDELDKKLCDRYPKIFANRNETMAETAMCWGFECGDGWYNIIDNLCCLIQGHLDWKNKKEETVDQVIATQVKEKLGTLRFYYDGGDDYINGLVRMAEAMSGLTCEKCGNKGKFRGKGWFYTACDEHSKPEDK